MKKHEMLNEMDEYERVSLQLVAILKLMESSGSNLDSDLHIACISLCTDLAKAKSKAYQTLHKAVMGGGD